METIEIKGKKLEVDYLGEGAWTKAYKLRNDVFLKVYNCPFKKALLKQSHPNLPKIEMLDESWFKMPYYEDVEGNKELKSIVWKMWKLVKRLRSIERTDKFTSIAKRKFPQYSDVFDALDSMIAESGATDIAFDFSPDNFGVDEVGNLIFRDVLLDFGAKSIYEIEKEVELSQ